MKERIFRFKQFSVVHSRSAMKVGVDGVLIGAWARCEGRRVLDAGCGCGLIALMLAQRFKDCRIDAIDIDTPSVEEAKENVDLSPWREYVTVEQLSYDELLLSSHGTRYDAIVSNPPFFDAGVSNPDTPRELARHGGIFSPKRLTATAWNLLNPHGTLSLIAPAGVEVELKEIGIEHGLSLSRLCYIRDNEGSAIKRVMMEFEKESPEGVDNNHRKGVNTDYLTLFRQPGVPTDEYRALCKDFYLKF